MSGTEGQRVVTASKVAGELMHRLGEEKRTVTYKDLAQAIGSAPDAKALAVALGRIQVLCHALSLPCLPAIVVRSDDGMPGDGFYGLFQSLFNEDLSERPSEREKDVHREQKVVQEWGADGWALLLEATQIVDKVGA